MLKLVDGIIIIAGTIIELLLLFSPQIFSNEILKFSAGIIVALDVLALLKILLNL
ncbi:MAG: hypothetical protein ACP5IB_06655 [Thermoplasmata archaeon]